MSGFFILLFILQENKTKPKKAKRKNDYWIPLMRNSVLKSNPFWSNNPPGPTTISEAQTTNYKVVVQNSNFISQRETPKFESESERKRAMTMGEDESSCSSNSGSAIDPPQVRFSPFSLSLALFVFLLYF